jgi:aminoglycoside 6'-N-acetyltransferase
MKSNAETMVPNPTVYSIRLSNITLKDLDTLVAWDAKDHVRNCVHNDGNIVDDDEWDWAYELSRTSLPWRHLLIAETLNNNTATPIGMLQIVDPALEETHYWGVDCPPRLRALDIWIGEEAYLGQGYGTQMMELALRDYCFVHDNVEAVLIDPLVSNTAAHRFYQRIGFQPIGVRQFDNDVCLVHRLNRTDFLDRYKTR